MTGAEIGGASIPPRSLPVSVRAPGKCILFGEHAVVHGQPELLLAIDLHTQVGFRRGTAMRLNADTEPLEHNRYLARAIQSHWAGEPPLALTVVSRLPRSAGLGSSAAFSAALAAGLGALRGGVDRPRLAERAFAIERGAQGVGSPGDTSAAVAGGYLTLNDPNGTPLWEVTDGARRWVVRRVPDPGWSWLVVYSGVPRDTGRTVEAVGRRLAEPDGPRLLESFARVASEGIAAVRSEDREAVGRALSRNHDLLVQIGVSHPRLEAIREAVGPACEGTKLTGAGAGGSVVALPRAGRELEALRRATRAGGVAFLVRPDPSGTVLVEDPHAAPS